jgi:hypothetical protein
MPCEHLQELYQLCDKHSLRIASSDAVRIVCRQCEEQEVCPSSLTDGENVLKASASPAPPDRKNDNDPPADS